MSDINVNDISVVSGSVVKENMQVRHKEAPDVRDVESFRSLLSETEETRGKKNDKKTSDSESENSMEKKSSFATSMVYVEAVEGELSDSSSESYSSSSSSSDDFSFSESSEDNDNGGSESEKRTMTRSNSGLDLKISSDVDDAARAPFDVDFDATLDINEMSPLSARDDSFSGLVDGFIDSAAEDLTVPVLEVERKEDVHVAAKEESEDVKNIVDVDSTKQNVMVVDKAQVAQVTDVGTISSAERISNIGVEIAERIMVSQAILGARQEVVVVFKENVLAGSQVSISFGEGNKLSLSFTIANPQSLEFLLAGQESLRGHLMEHIKTISGVEIKFNEHGEGGDYISQDSRSGENSGGEEEERAQQEE